MFNEVGGNSVPPIIGRIKVVSKTTSWQWLDDITKEDVENNPLPFKQLLEDSVYYPASGTDGEPVKHLNKLSYSFIYVDNNCSLERLHQEMIVHGFKGYEIFAERLVK